MIAFSKQGCFTEHAHTYQCVKLCNKKCGVKMLTDNDQTVRLLPHSQDTTHLRPYFTLNPGVANAFKN